MRFSEFYGVLGTFRGAKKALAEKLGCTLVEVGYWATGRSAIPLKYWDKIVEATKGNVTEKEIKDEQLERANAKDRRALSPRRQPQQGDSSRPMGGGPDRAAGLSILAEGLSSVPAGPQSDERGREADPLPSDQLCESAPAEGVSAAIARLLEGVRKSEGHALQAALAECASAKAGCVEAVGAYVD